MPVIGKIGGIGTFAAIMVLRQGSQVRQNTPTATLVTPLSE